MAAVLAFASRLDPSHPMKPQDSMTPMSQASTAANTPTTLASNDKGFQFPDFEEDDVFGLPSGLDEETAPFAVSLPNLTSESQGSDDEATSLAAPVLQSELGRWAWQQVEAKEWLEAARSQKVAALALRELQSDLARWARRSVEAETWLREQRRVRGFQTTTPTRIGRSRDRVRPSCRPPRERRPVRKARTMRAPTMQSDLGRWAEALVKAEEWLQQARIDHAVRSAGTLELTSDLGRWATNQVAAEEWLSQQ